MSRRRDPFNVFRKFRRKSADEVPAVMRDAPAASIVSSPPPRTEVAESASESRESRFGLEVLVDGVRPTVDVVAIHGLNGHREKTWTAENNVNWLRDQTMLPAIIPDARIMSWGYDANTHSTKPLSNMRLNQHAEKLVSDLCLHRKQDETDRRPLIFIVHSLGGIVLKDALIHSDSARPGHLYDHKAIKTSTYGIIFMGTPHQGGEGVALAQIILRVASIFKNTNSQLLDILQKDSEILERQLDQYNAISSEFKTKFAFETYETPLSVGQKLLVVPRSSAVVPGHVNAEPIAIMRDHINMVKFKSSGNADFKTVSGHMKMMAKEAPAKVQENWRKEDDRKAFGDAQRLKHDIEKQCFVISLDDSQAKKKSDLLCWLCEVDPSEIYNGAINKHQSGTSSWLVESEEFKNWEKSAGSLLWLHGKAGSGKSILSSFTIRYLRNQCSSDPRTAVAQFFFSFHDAKKQTVAGMLASLVKQLCSSRPDMPQQLKHFGQFKERGERPDNKTLNDGLIAIIHGFSAVYIVVDALDECPTPSSEREDLLKFLRRFVDEMPHHVHIFCTSRTGQDIDTVIRPLLALSSRAELNLAAHRKSLNRDIELYIDSVLDSDAYSTWPDEIKAEAKISLVERADGMFQYVYCQFEVLKDFNSPALVRKALDDLPVGLDVTYDRMLRSIDKKFQNQVLSALKWLVASRRVISLQQLAEIFILRPERTVVLDKDERLFKPEACLKYVSGLVETYQVYRIVRHGGGHGEVVTRVRLAHFSVKEYLMSSRIAKCFSFTKMDAHLHVAHSCLAYHLYLSSLDGDGHGLKLQRYELQRYELRRYAADEWPRQLEMVPRKEWPAEVACLAARALATQSTSLRLTISDVAWKRYLPTRAGPVFEDRTAITRQVLNCHGLLKGLISCFVISDESGDCHQEPWPGAMVVNDFESMAQRPHCYTAGAGFVQLTDMLLGGGPGTNRYLTQDDLDMALVEAANTAHIDVVKLLLDRGANIKAQSMAFGGPLQAAAAARRGSTEVVEFLLGRGADINAQYGETGSALQAAASRNNLAVVQLLVDRGANLDLLVSSNTSGCALVSSVPGSQSAVYARSSACLRFLLDSGANIDNHGGVDGTALCKAAAYPYTQGECFRLLLERGANVNEQAGRYGNALQAACFMRSSKAIVQLLLDKGADANAQGGDFGNALQAACYMSTLGEKYKGSVVEALINGGANIHTQGGIYGNALQAAACLRSPFDDLDGRFEGSAAQALANIYKGANIGSPGDDALQAECYRLPANPSGPYNGSVVEALINRGADINARGGHLGTALQSACTGYKDGHLVQILLDKGADVNIQGGEYGNALQAACYHLQVKSKGDLDSRVKLLLDSGADVNAQGGIYGIALQAAAAGSGTVTTMELLLSRGARINEQGGHYGTALQAACASPETGTAIPRLLIDHGADVHAQGGFFGSAWHAAAAQMGPEHDAILQMLLDEGVDVNDARGRQHPTALEAAVPYLDRLGEIGHQQLWQFCDETPDYAVNRLRFLLDRGANVNLPAGKYGFPLQSACARDDTAKPAELLLDNCPDIDVNAQGGVFGSALQAAAYSGHMSLVRLLLDKGARINVRGGKYRSALNAAVFRCFWGVVEVLLDRGAKPDSQQLPEPDQEWLRGIEEELGHGAIERYSKFWEVHGVGEAQPSPGPGRDYKDRDANEEVDLGIGKAARARRGD